MSSPLEVGVSVGGAALSPVKANVGCSSVVPGARFLNDEASFFSHGFEAR